MQKVILVCGVSGSGKTWVSDQMQEKFHYIPHDLHYQDHAEVVIDACKNVSKPIITECPFAERVLRQKLEEGGCEVIPVFVVEEPDLIAERYLSREGKPLPKSAYTRAGTIINRAEEWEAFHGRAEEVLAHLKSI